MLIKKQYGRPVGKAEDPDGVYVDILTPSDPEQRGAQLSLAFNVNIHRVIDELYKRGVSVSINFVLYVEVIQLYHKI